MASSVCSRALCSFRFTGALRHLAASRRLQSTSSDPPATPKITCDAYLSNTKVDIEKLFIDRKVQSILKELTGLDLDRIYAAKKQAFTVPQYKLLTDEELQKEILNAVRRAERKIQMPPVLRKRTPCERALRRDPEMQGLEEHPFIFTDISFGYTDRERPIVVREPSGKLRTATWEERERMLQTFFTKADREIEIPKMFTEPYLTNVLSKFWYIFVLDRACAQFEPDNEAYVGVTHRVYEHINEARMFDRLRSSRHFGPMCFYHAVTKTGDNLMIDVIQRQLIEDGGAFVKLLHIVHTDSRSIQEVNEESTPMDYIEAYIKFEAQNKASLELAMQTYREILAEKEPSTVSRRA